MIRRLLRALVAQEPTDARAIRSLGLASAVLLASIAFDANAQGSRVPLDYYRVVQDQNVFRRLGWAPPTDGPPFTLLMTVVSAPPEQPTAATMEADFWSGLMGGPPLAPAPPPEPRPDRALLAQSGGPATHYVAVGDRVRSFVVKSIAIGKVQIESEDGKQKYDLALAEAEMGSGGGGDGGPRGGGRGGGGGPAGPSPGGARGAGGQNRPGGPGGANFREQMQRFQNMSPEEREQMRQRFREGGGFPPGGGGPTRG